MLATVRRSSRPGTWLGVLPLALLACFAVPVLAQVSNAVVTGIVTDEQRGILPGVTITVTNAESGVVRTSVTEEYGRYRLGGIPPGRYNLKAELPGFATQEVKDITLTLGLEYTKDFILGVQGPPKVKGAHYHAVEALNFHITMWIAGLVNGLLILLLIGIVLLPLVLLFGAIFSIVAAVQAYQGQYYRYPLSIRLIS